MIGPLVVVLAVLLLGVVVVVALASAARSGRDGRGEQEGGGGASTAAVVGCIAAAVLVLVIFASALFLFMGTSRSSMSSAAALAAPPGPPGSLSVVGTFEDLDRPAHFDDVVERTVRGALLDGAVVDATGSGMSSSSGFFSTSEDYRSSYFVSPGDASTPGAACLDLDALQKGLAGFVTAVTAAGDARAVVVVTYSPIDGSEPRRFVLDTGEGGTAFAPAASEPAEPRAPDDDGTDG
ncbi:MAG: hypothetical protein R3F34_06710 [Planctomycetota bacterium]